MKRGPVFALILLLFTLPYMAALIDTTQTNINTNSGFLIDYPKFDAIKINQPFNLSIHVYNISNGIEITSANCTLMIYNQTGERVISQDLTNTAAGFNRLLTAGNFTQSGKFIFNIYCSSSPSVLGGFADGTFKVTRTGTILNIEEAIIYGVSVTAMFTLFFILMFFAITIEWRNKRDDDGKILSVNKFKYIKLALIPICYALFSWILNLLLGLSGFLSLPMYEGLFAFLFETLIRLSWPFLFVWGAVFLWVIYNDSKIGHMLKRGFRPR